MGLEPRAESKCNNEKRFKRERDKMEDIKFGVIGTGMIASVVANSIENAENTNLLAVSSRTLARAVSFVSDRKTAIAVEGVDNLLKIAELDVVYVAKPTAAKEDIVFAAIAAGKHVLVEKPLPESSAVRRMIEAANTAGVVFMDATHFVHHPRNHAIRSAIAEKIGQAKSMHSAFYFPIDDKENIRYNQEQEPMGALGDMGWYSMRAVVEYLQPKGNLNKAAVVAERDEQTGAVKRLSGVIGFESGESSTFDFGYTAGTGIMDLSLLGTKGMISMDDFVLDWNNSFVFQEADVKTGFIHRTAMASRKDFDFIATPADKAADVIMIERFVELVKDQDVAALNDFSEKALKTQQLLDAIWEVTE